MGKTGHPQLEPSGKGSWTFRASVLGPNGQRQQRRFTFNARTLTEARKKQTELLNDLNKGTNLQPNKVTVADYLEHWMKNYAKLKIDPKTWENYATVLRCHIVPCLGHIALQQLGTAEIQAFYSAKSKTLSASRVRTAHVILHQALNKAVAEKLLVSNPTDATEKPKVEKHSAGKAYEPQQIFDLIEASKGSVVYIAVVLAVYSGMRLGEVSGLRWEELNLENGTLLVKQSLQWTKALGLRFKPPKNGREATISLPAPILPLLREWKAQQDEHKRTMGGKYVDYGLVWPYEDGKPRHINQSSRAFREFMKRSGLPPIRFHDLRHSHATIMLMAGVPLTVVSKRLRHASTAITGDIYGHLTKAADEQAAATFGDLVG